MEAFGPNEDIGAWLRCYRCWSRSLEVQLHVEGIYKIDPDSADDWQVAERLNHALVRRALSMGGTCSGEHGIGLHKMAFLREEAGDGAVAAMRAIKRALEPDGIMNPGKIFV